jgi:hypothetical protein
MGKRVEACDNRINMCPGNFHAYEDNTEGQPETAVHTKANW